MKRRSKNPPKYFTPEEIDSLFRVITSARDRALFRVAYHRGLRASELGMLQLPDYRPKMGRLFVRRLKGSHSGEYHLTQAEQHALRAWLRERGGAQGPLFVSRNHRPIPRFRLDQLIKHYCRRGLEQMMDQQRHGGGALGCGFFARLSGTGLGAADAGAGFLIETERSERVRTDHRRSSASGCRINASQRKHALFWPASIRLQPYNTFLESPQ